MSTGIGTLRIQVGQVLIEVPYLVSYDKSREQALGWATKTLEYILANAVLPTYSLISHQTMSPLPKTPADCQAPFKTEIGRRLWPYAYTPDVVDDANYGAAARDYPLAQQAEFEHLWLRELHQSVGNVSVRVDSTDGSDADRFWSAYSLIRTYLTPNTPDHE